MVVKYPRQTMPTKRITSLLPVLLMIFCLLWRDDASAQQGVGVVTAIQGQAELTRGGNRSGLRFRENLMLRDAIDTFARSSLRILFDGKSTLTMRELSHLDVREEVLGTGGVRTTHSLSSGAVLLRVVRQLMQPGDEVRIQTPNAVAAVRGTTIFVQYSSETQRSIFSLLIGNASVTPQGLAPINLVAGTAVSVTGGSGTAIQVDQPQTLAPAEAAAITGESELSPVFTGEAGREATVRAFAESAAKEQITVGSAQCWPYLLCETRQSAAGTLISIPLPVGGSVTTGSGGNRNLKTSTAPLRGS
jgi:hypothetical protein